MGNVAESTTPTSQPMESRECPVCHGTGSYAVNEDNHVIIEMLSKRMREGMKKYGHGIQVDDKYNWYSMATEELIDALQYLTAATIRQLRTTTAVKRPASIEAELRKKYDEVKIDNVAGVISILAYRGNSVSCSFGTNKDEVFKEAHTKMLRDFPE